MKDYGLVSIITPAWACAPYICETIRSVMTQTYQNWELLIQDDCSLDGIRNIVEKMREENPEHGEKIRYECNDEWSGAAITINNALRRAKGKWIAFLDADDVWLPEKLERQLGFMVGNGYKFSYTAYKEMDNDSRETGVEIRGPRHVTKMGLQAFCWLGCLTVMYDREAVGVVQIADVKRNNDYAMWLKVCRKVDCFLLDEVLAVYRRDCSASVRHYLTMIRWHYRLWHEAEGMSVVASAFWTCVNVVCGMYKKIIYVKKI